jgi:hypothetical protein
MSIREPPYPEIFPVDTTEIRITALVICAMTGIPALFNAITNGEALLPEPPKRLGSFGLTVRVIIKLPKI